MTLRALVVDDEAPARGRLRQLLAERDDIEVVGEAEDGVDALERIHALTPDVVFLDIQMPGCTGLDVAASLGQPRPAIIFCTAFDQHAVDAFELQAVDYLLKPVTRARLDAALGRLMPGAADGARIGRGPKRCWDRRRGSSAVAAHASTSCPPPTVVAFSFDDGQTRLHTATDQLWMQPTLAQLLRRLDPQQFVQVVPRGGRAPRRCPRGQAEQRRHRPDRAVERHRRRGVAPPLAAAARSARALALALACRAERQRRLEAAGNRRPT